MKPSERIHEIHFDVVKERTSDPGVVHLYPNPSTMMIAVLKYLDEQADMESK